MSPRQSIHGQWSSRLAFVLAASGSAIGLGNIWRFPYVAGEHGGGAFVLAYLACALAIGLPIMMTEILIGRRGRRNPISAMRLMSEEEAGHAGWGWVGMLGVLTGLLILSYYAVVAGWTFAYVFEFARGAAPKNAAAAEALFTSVQRDWLQTLACHTAFMGVAAYVVGRGVAGGLERTVKLVLPLLVALLGVLVLQALWSGAAREALGFMLRPAWERIDAELLLAALGQVFFALSIGMGALMAYAAYLPPGTSISRASTSIVAANTVVSLLAGLVVFALTFSHGLDRAQGEGLMFQALPLAFADLPGGAAFGALFFLLLTAAALTAAIALIEPAVAWLVERFAVDRGVAAWLTASAVWALGLLTILSFGPLAAWRLGGITLYEQFAFVTSQVLLPAGALALAVFAGWVMCKGSTVEELDVGVGLRYSLWRLSTRLVAPLGLAFILWRALGAG